MLNNLLVHFWVKVCSSLRPALTTACWLSSLWLTRACWLSSLLSSVGVTSVVADSWSFKCASTSSTTTLAASASVRFWDLRWSTSSLVMSSFSSWLRARCSTSWEAVVSSSRTRLALTSRPPRSSRRETSSPPRLPATSSRL